MNRRWIRIDRAHRTFDCSPREFDAMLVEARAEDELGGASRESFGQDEWETEGIEADDFQLQEAINAELAILANLQRRERILKSELEQAEKARRLEQWGEILADQHAEWLRYNQNQHP